MTIPLDQHNAIVQALQAELEEAKTSKLALAILLVRAAGDKITVPPATMLSITNRSYIQEDRHEDGTIVFSTWETPLTEGMH